MRIHTRRELALSSCHLKCQPKHWIFIHRVSHKKLDCTTEFIKFERFLHFKQIKMACRRFIANYCASGNLKAARSLPILSARNYSTTKREDIATTTHTGQVRSKLKSFVLFLTQLLHSKIHCLFTIFQVFEADDYRNVRFKNATRYVNKNWGTMNISTIHKNWKNNSSWIHFTIISCCRF